MDVATAGLFRTLLRWACSTARQGDRGSPAASSATPGPPAPHQLERLLDDLELVTARLPATTTLAAELARDALQHGVLPLVCEALLESRSQAPQRWQRSDWNDCLATLTSLRDRDLGISLAQVGLLQRSQQALHQADIVSCACKGPIIGQLAYGGWSRRQSGQDIDLLVAARDLERACVALADLGFQPVRPLPRRSRQSAMHHFGEITLRHADGALIDLHWRLGMPYYRFTPDTDALLVSSRVISLDGLQGSTVATLSPAETVLFAAIHGCKENWEQWRWLMDAALLLERTPPAVLREALALAHARGCQRMLLTTLDLVNRISDQRALHLDISERDPTAVVVSRACELSLLARSRPQRHLLCELTEGWHDRICALTAIARPWPVDWQHLDLPPSWSWLYWLYRPWRLAGKYLGRAVGVGKR